MVEGSDLIQNIDEFGSGLGVDMIYGTNDVYMHHLVSIWNGFVYTRIYSGSYRAG